MMSESPQEELIAVAEIGASAVKVLIGRRSKRHMVVVGKSVVPMRGMRRGEVFSQSHLAQGLANALEDAESLSGGQADTLYMSTSGGYCRGLRSTGRVPVLGRTVTREDMEEAIHAGVAGQVKPGKTLLHKLVREWVVDGRGGVSRPEGMAASSLEVRLHLVVVETGSLTALKECARLCQKTLGGVYLDVLAAGEAVLSDVEKERGCVLLDIGAGSTDVAIWSDGTMVHNTVIPRGGDALTEELATMLKVRREVAEQLKRRHGLALVSSVSSEEKFSVPGEFGAPPKQHARKLLATVIEPSLDEILRTVRREIELTGYEDGIDAGFILTGGASTMPDLVELATRRFGMPVRLGIPGSDPEVAGMVDLLRHPKDSVAVGLLKLAHQSPSGEGIENVGPLSRFGGYWAKFRGYIARML